jgi:hypothetical protein
MDSMIDLFATEGPGSTRAESDCPRGCDSEAPPARAGVGGVVSLTGTLKTRGTAPPSSPPGGTRGPLELRIRRSTHRSARRLNVRTRTV